MNRNGLIDPVSLALVALGACIILVGFLVLFIA
jgi:hypothetical protein